MKDHSKSRANDVDGKYSQALDGDFVLLLFASQITPIVITMLLIIYGMWKIKQKPWQFITNLNLRGDLSSLKAEKEE